MELNRREFLRGAIATAAAAGWPISGAIALADVIKPDGMPAALVPYQPLWYEPSFEVRTIADLRAHIESMLAIRPRYERVFDNEATMIGFGLAKEGADAIVERWTGNFFALGWDETQEMVEDGLYEEGGMIEKTCRCLSIAASHWVEKEGLRGHEAVWRRPIAHRADREFESGAIKHIISFRIAVKA